ncbi:SoxR reducing system RseC family protein [Parathalassolituus penaei]|uniref:SoxR reducing system RseC family protein n=1 Tax=Parathalassolituus penaei TaxID=2997323 RepID=A0A9X3EFT6_9GAMM|nr:SoxR reducing system RseC family protein [Parathalassolituus penaei]MCY0965944.1 SoxR reducing system RseC family protein [Parathalassolituus penaei]
MSQEIVEVKEIGSGGVWVEGIQKSACGSCNARKGCGHASLAELGRPMRLWISTSERLDAGQHVVLDLPDGALAASATTLYGLPLVALIIGAISGQNLGGDTAALVLGGGGLVAGFLLARHLASRNRERWQPRIVSVCERPGF